MSTKVLEKAQVKGYDTENRNQEYLEEKAVEKFDRIYGSFIYSLRITKDDSLRCECFRLFQEIRGKFKAGVKFKGPENLAPIIIYIFFKVKGYSINAGDLRKALGIERRHFLDGMKKVIPFYPAYSRRDRKIIILDKIRKVRSHFNLDSEFIKNSELILKNCLYRINPSSEEVMAGAACILSLMKIGLDSINFNEVCKKTGTRECSVGNYLKRQVFRRFGILGFHGLRKSSELIMRVLEERFDVR